MQSSVTVCGLVLLILSVRGRVVEPNFNMCRNFFYNNFEPQGLNSGNDVHICQYFQENYRFATLYDTHHRIPVYSAYVFQTNQSINQSLGRVHSSTWFEEPQLVNRSWNNNMMTAERMIAIFNTNINVIGQNQAVDEDYRTLSHTYNRGHLNPKSHHQGDNQRATYTLTNVVPQNAKLNRRAWAQYEQSFIRNCNKAFVLVGAIPSTNNWANGRVNIPDYLWHAYCCLDSNDNLVKSGAATMKNRENNKQLTVVNNFQECSLEELQQFFEKLNRGSVILFNNCNAPATTNGNCSRIII